MGKGVVNRFASAPCQSDDGQGARHRRAADPARPRRRGDRMMKRREFITLLGGAVVCPLAARAQQPDRLRRIGVLMGTAESDPDQKAMVSVFTRALEDLGWKEGANIRIDRRWAGDACHPPSAWNVSRQPVQVA